MLWSAPQSWRHFGDGSRLLELAHHRRSAWNPPLASGSPRIRSLLAQIDLLKSCAKLIDRYLLNQELRPLELCLNRCRGVGSLLDRFEFSEPFIANPRLAHLVRSFADERREDALQSCLPAPERVTAFPNHDVGVDTSRRPRSAAGAWLEGLLDLDASLIDRGRRQMDCAKRQREAALTVGIRHHHDGKGDVQEWRSSVTHVHAALS